MAPSLRSPFSPAQPCARRDARCSQGDGEHCSKVRSDDVQHGTSCGAKLRWCHAVFTLAEAGVTRPPLPPPRFDTHFPPVLPVKTCAGVPGMSENDALYCIRHADGSVSLYIDEEYAAERGVDPATLTRVEIPRELFSTGTIQQIREYVAVYLEGQQTGTA